MPKDIYIVCDRGSAWLMNFDEFDFLFFNFRYYVCVSACEVCVCQLWQQKDGDGRVEEGISIMIDLKLECY